MALGIGKNVASAKKKKITEVPVEFESMITPSLNHISLLWQMLFGHLQRDEQRTPYSNEQQAAGNGL